jgi:hypothetical protein
MEPTIGRVLHYKLSENDAEQINRRRTTSSAIAERIETGTWPLGAQAHIGNAAHAGDVLPLHVVRVWPDECGPGKTGVNGQVLLDGNDALWVTSVCEGDGEGQWMWPPRV